MTPARIIVTGGRHYADRDTVDRVLKAALQTWGWEMVIVHGDARGADRLCADVARDLGIETEAHPANWDRYGKRAGVVRNQEMIDYGADLVIAFAGGRGTADCVRRARRARILVTEIE